MAVGDEVPGVVVAWGAILLAGAGVAAALPPVVSRLLAWPGFLLSPIAAALLVWRGFDRVRLGVFAVAAFAVGLACRVAFDAGLVAVSPAAAFRLRLGLPLLVLLAGHFAAGRVAPERASEQ